MKKIIATLAVCCLFAAPAFGQISTNFASMQIGLQDFTLTDPNDSAFTAAFASPGEIGFFNNGSLYNGGNRAFVVGSSQTASIIFSTLADVTISGLDTDGQVTGGASQTVAGGTTLGLADGSVEAFDANNNSVGVFTFGEAGFTSNTFTSPVLRLDITNNGPDDSFALLGSINAQATAVPEPGSAMVLGLASLLLIRRKRS